MSADEDALIQHRHSLHARPLRQLLAEPEPPGRHVADEYEEELACHECGLRILALLMTAPVWVHRRVESVHFHDDRTVRRRVSVDFTIPQDAPVVEVSGHEYCLLPLAIMRRKSLVRFDLADEDERAVGLPGLRHNQTLTLSMATAFAEECLGRPLPGAVTGALPHYIAGTQQQLEAADDLLKQVLPKEDDSTRELQFLLTRLANNFVMVVAVAPDRPRRILKFSYDEPLSLHYRNSRFGPDGTLQSGGARPKRRFWFVRNPVAALGWTATLVRFPVPAAENARSFHFEVNAPPGVEIVTGSILAGRPGSSRRPSFDHVSGGYPTVDLHVTDVPRGSISQVQIGLQARRYPWLTLAVVINLMAGALLYFPAKFGLEKLASLDRFAIASLFVGFAVGSAAVLVRPAEHRMASKLFYVAGLLASSASLCPLAAAALVTFYQGPHLRTAIRALGIVAGIAGGLLTIAWFRTTIRSGDRCISPWEQGLSQSIGALDARRVQRDQYKTYARAVREFGYDHAAIEVATAEAEHLAEALLDDDLERSIRVMLRKALARHEDRPEPPGGG